MIAKVCSNKEATHCIGKYSSAMTLQPLDLNESELSYAYAKR